MLYWSVSTYETAIKYHKAINYKINVLCFLWSIFQYVPVVFKKWSWLDSYHWIFQKCSSTCHIMCWCTIIFWQVSCNKKKLFVCDAQSSRKATSSNTLGNHTFSRSQMFVFLSISDGLTGEKLEPKKFLLNLLGAGNKS